MQPLPLSYPGGPCSSVPFGVDRKADTPCAEVALVSWIDATTSTRSPVVACVFDASTKTKNDDVPPPWPPPPVGTIWPTALVGADWLKPVPAPDVSLTSSRSADPTSAALAR